MNNDDFHKPFIDSLVLIAFVAMILLFSSREIIKTYIPSAQKTPQYTSQPSYENNNEGSEK
jgi:biopolymer transport protein ExbD